MKRSFMYKIITFSFFIFLGITATAQETKMIFGKILNQEDQPISNAIISIENDTYNVETAENGDFKFEKEVQLPLTISIMADGLNSTNFVITKQNWNEQTGLKIYLSKESTQLGEVLISSDKKNSYYQHTITFDGKLNGNLKDLPQTISIANRQLMDDKQAFKVSDMVHDLSGVNQASSYDDYTLRGFSSGYGNSLRLVNGLRSGFGYGTSYFNSPLTINLERIEVLKGSGGTLFGDIAPGGTINLVTKKPLEDFKGAVSFSSGSFETLRTTLDIGGPLSNNLFYRLNAGYQTSKTFRKNNNQKIVSVAPSFTFKPRKGTQIDVDLTYDNFDGYLDRGMGVKQTDLYAINRSFTLSQPSDFFKTETFSFRTKLTQKILENLSLTLNYSKSIYKEKLNEHRTLNSFADAPYNTIVNMRFLSREATDYTDNAVAFLNYKLQKGQVKQNIIFGVDYAQYKPDADNQQKEARSKEVNGEIVPLTFDLNHPVYESKDLSSYKWLKQASFPFLSSYKTTGVYVQDQVKFNRLEMLFGLRYEHYTSESADPKTPYSATQDTWLPRVGLTYKVTATINYFANYSQGYVPIAADYVANYKNYGADKPFKSERSFQLETGLKTEFFKKKLQIDLALYQIQRNDMMMPTGQLSDAGFPVYRQSGKVSSKGLELDLRGQLHRNLQMSFNYTYTDTEVKASSVASEVGMPLPNAPKNMANVWLKYSVLHDTFKGLGFGLGASYVSDRRMENSVGKDAQGNAEWGFLPDYTVVNAAIYYDLNPLKISVQFNNIFDKYYFQGGIDYTRVFPGSPSNMMATLSYSF
ncbi:TonB-dependent receptor [Empedobacter falsenii]|uniref:TonB-dependent receptor n=1 Tax=Empedobacter falsenii TaxID=343874 RepID=UPI0021AD6228|nr:TonB-dependent receptor [Empedobacter falsenii]